MQTCSFHFPSPSDLLWQTSSLSLLLFSVPISSHTVVFKDKLMHTVPVFLWIRNWFKYCFSTNLSGSTQVFQMQVELLKIQVSRAPNRTLARMLSIFGFKTPLSRFIRMNGAPPPMLCPVRKRPWIDRITNSFLTDLPAPNVDNVASLLALKTSVYPNLTFRSKSSWAKVIKTPRLLQSQLTRV